MYRNLLLIIFFFLVSHGKGVSQISDIEICHRCLGMGSTICQKCDGDGISDTDEDGLAIFCSECAYSGCNPDKVGSKLCTACYGFPFSSKNKSNPKKTSTLSDWIDLTIDAAALFTYTLALIEMDKERRWKRQDYFDAKRYRREFEKQREELERKRRIEKYNAIEQFDNDYVLNSHYKIQDNFSDWIGSISIDLEDWTFDLGPLYINKKPYFNRIRPVVVTNEEKKMLIAPDSYIELSFKVISDAAFYNMKFRENANIYGASAMKISLYQNNSSKTLIGKDIIRLKLNAITEKEKYSNNDIRSIKGNIEKYTSQGRYYIITPINNCNIGDEYILEVVFGAYKDGYQDLSLYQTIPKLQINILVVKSSKMKKHAKIRLRRLRLANSSDVTPSFKGGYQMINLNKVDSR